MLHNLDTIYFKPDLVRISQPKLISVRTFFWFTEVDIILLFPLLSSWPAPVAILHFHLLRDCHMSLLGGEQDSCPQLQHMLKSGSRRSQENLNHVILLQWL